MTKIADFMVILRHDISETNILLLSPIAHPLRLKGGQTARVLWCKTVDSSFGGYASLEAKLVANNDFLRIRIPHWLILAIAGGKNAPPIGFVWEEDSQ